MEGGGARGSEKECEGGVEGGRVREEWRVGK